MNLAGRNVTRLYSSTSGRSYMVCGLGRLLRGQRFRALQAISKIVVDSSTDAITATWPSLVVCGHNLANFGRIRL